MQLRPYQEEAADAIMANLAAHGSTLCVMATGLGKTVVLSEIVRRCPGRAILFTHREELLWQGRNKLQAMMPHEHIDIEMAEYSASLKTGDMPKCVVASVQSLHAKRLPKFKPELFDLLIFDECFPAGTLVDGVPIEGICVGDTLTSFNDVEQSLALGDVTHVFKKRPGCLLAVTLVSGRRVICTPNHPFWTPNGYINAEDLIQGQMLHVLRQGSGAGAEADRRRQSLLRQGVYQRFSAESVIGNNGTDKPSPCLSTNEVQQSDGEGGKPREDGSKPQEDWTQADEAWRQRNWSIPSGEAASAGTARRMEVESRSMDLSETRLGLPGVLQAGPGTRGLEARSGGGWRKSHDSEQKGAGREEGELLEFDWVDCVEVLEPGCDGTFGGLCPDGFVYNLEVDGFSNYFADGVLVHNCHHVRVKNTTIYGRILEHFSQNPRIKMLGVTATPDRHDGKSLGTIFKSVAYDYSLPRAIEDGYLVPIRQNMVTITSLNLESVGTYMGDLAAGSLDEVMSTERNLLGVAYPTLELTGDRKTLIFTAGVHQAHRLAEILNREKPGSANAIDGSMSRNFRRDLVESYNNGGFQFLVNCNIATEGFDSPAIECVVMARPTKSRPLYCFDGKTEILTERGWVRGLNLATTDSVASYDTLTGNIQWEMPTAYLARPGYENESFYGLQTPQVDFRVTENHRMVIRTRTGRVKSRTPWRFVEAKGLSENHDLFELPSAGIQDSAGLPLTFHELQFIGWFLTDGCWNKKNNCITITQDIDQPWNDKIEECLNGCGFKFSKDVVTRKTTFKEASTINVYRVSKGKPRGTKKHLRGWELLEPYLDKDLSPLLELATPEQLGHILLAMHYGDGQKFKDVSWTQRSYHIATGRKLLADKLQSLCVRRGFSCNVATGFWNQNPIYILHIRKKTTRSLRFSPDRKYKPETTPVGNEYVWCVEVSTGAVVVRRNGKVLVSGNCQMLGRGTRILPGVIEGTDGQGLDFQLQSGEERRSAIQGSAKPACTVIDFTGNSGKHRLVHPADVLGGTAEPISDELSELINIKVSKATADGQALDVSKAIDEAKQELEARKKLEELLEAERIAKLREVVRAKVQYTLKTISPLDVFSLPEAPKGNIGMDFAKRPTETQVKALRDNGVDVHYDQGDWWIGPPKFKAEWQKITQGTAGKLLNSLKERRKQNICSYKQAMLLARFGEDPHCSFQDAKRIINEIAKNNWQPRKQTIDDLAEQQARQGAEHVKFKWVEKRQLTAEAVAWMTKERDDAYTKPEKKRYLDNCLKLNRVPLGCPIKDAIQTTQERVAVEVKVPTKKAPQKPKVQQAIDF